MGGTNQTSSLVSETTIDPDPVATRWSADLRAARRGWWCALALAVSLLALVPAVAAILLLVGAIVALVRRDRTLPDPMPALRFLVVGCLALTIVLTWGLWQVRTYPPLLEVPGFPVPQAGVGVPLLVTLGLSLARPRLGVVLFSCVLGYSFLADQTRLQPEFLSLGLLLVTTTLGAAGPALARAHLASMWCWAGVHKLLSLGFIGGSSRWIFSALPVRPAALADSFGWFVAGLEIAVGVLVAVPRTRRLGVALALLLHGTVLYVLSPLGHGWNESVWPWNLAIPLAAVAVFWPRPSPRDGLAAGRRATASVCCLLAVFPVGFYFGLVDAYPAHSLYSDNTAAGYCEPACTNSWAQDTWSAFGVPLPPEPRLFRSYFEKTCTAGDRLIVAPRRVRVLAGLHTATEQHECPRVGPADAAAPGS